MQSQRTVIPVDDLSWHALSRLLGASKNGESWREGSHWQILGLLVVVVVVFIAVVVIDFHFFQC
jgi:hypothetical protein